MGRSTSGDDSQDNRPTPPRVTADFGGRRKTFERRLKKKTIPHQDRRSNSDRRSGFDRRSLNPEKSIGYEPEKRENPPEPENQH